MAITVKQIYEIDLSVYGLDKSTVEKIIQNNFISYGITEWEYTKSHKLLIKNCEIQKEKMEKLIKHIESILEELWDLKWKLICLGVIANV